MDSQEKGYKQEAWKSELRSKMITALIGAPSEKIQAYNEVGYYYQCYASSSLYKYYSDTELCLNSIQNNQMWYSAPCNFNDVFDCDISIDDKKVFNEALKLFPDKRGIRPGSNAWKNFRLTMNQQLRVLRATVSAKYSCGFPNPRVLPIIVVDRYLDYFTTIMEDRSWQVLAKPVFRWRNRSSLLMNAARAAWQMLTGVVKTTLR